MRVEGRGSGVKGVRGGLEGVPVLEWRREDNEEERTMTYPAPHYFAETGEVSARFRAATTPADIQREEGGAFHYIATAASTGSDFGLYRIDMSEVATGAALHFHRTFSESFYVLSGRVRFSDGEKWFDGVAGDFVYIPAGGLHAFRNESGEPASMLLLFVPGASREGYFEGLSKLGQMSESERREFFISHDNLFAE
jgi:mannose-6-phosphate isomerase-like protein (cupin superfamily)